MKTIQRILKHPIFWWVCKTIIVIVLIIFFFVFWGCNPSYRIIESAKTAPIPKYPQDTSAKFEPYYLYPVPYATIRSEETDILYRFENGIWKEEYLPTASDAGAIKLGRKIKQIDSIVPEGTSVDIYCSVFTLKTEGIIGTEKIFNITKDGIRTIKK